MSVVIFPRLDRWLSGRGFLSKTALTLAGLGLLLALISFIKGIQVLIFIPAFVLALFVYSYFEVRSLRRKLSVSWQTEGRLALTLALARPHPGAVFFLAAEQGLRLQLLTPDESLRFQVPKARDRLFLLAQGRLGIFRAVLPIAQAPAIRQHGEIADGEGEMYLDLKKYEEGDELKHIDALQTARRQAWFVRKIVYEAPLRRLKKQAEVLRFLLRSNAKLSKKRDVAAGLLGEWAMIAVIIIAAHLEWRNIVFTLIALLSAVFVFCWTELFKWRKPGHRLMNTTALFLFVGCFIEGGIKDDTVMAGAHFLILLSIFKHLFQRERRDAFTYVFLSLFVFVALSLYTLSAWFIFLFFIFLHLSVQHFAAYSAGEKPEEFGRAFETPVIAKSSYLMSAIVLMLTLGLYFVLPHGDRGKDTSLLQKSAPVSETGFDDSVSLTDVRSIKQDFAKKIVIENADPRMLPIFKQLYWRGTRFTTFKSGEWTKPEATLKPFSGNFERAKSATGRAAWQIRYYFKGEQTVFFPEAPVAVAGRRMFFVGDATDPTLLRLAVPHYNDALVKAEFLTDHTGIPVPAAIPDNAPAAFSLDPEVERLFAPFWQSLPPEVTKNPQRLSEYIRDDAGFAYALEDTAPDLESFLYHTKRGHCEYFATVLALSLQHFGFAATFVNGYQSGEFNPGAAAFIIRGVNAHSWVEVFDPQAGFTRFDPTPASSESFFALRESPLMRRLTQAYDMVEIKWFEYFVSFTGERQRAFFWQLFRHRHEIFWLLIGQYVLRKTVPPLIRAVRTARARTPKERFLWWLGKKTGGKVFILQLLENRFPVLVRKTRALIFGSQPAYEEIRDLKRQWRRALRRGKDQ